MIKLHPKYQPLWLDTTSRYFVITGGRGSGKSFGVGVNLLHSLFNADEKVLFTRYTLKSAHLSIIPEFKEKIELEELQNSFHITKSEIINKSNGSVLAFTGLKTASGDQTANLKSLQGISTWVLDEAEELTDESTFDKIDLSVRSNKARNRVILIMNPTTKEHWIYKRFFEGAGVQAGFNGVKGNVRYIHTDYRDNITNLDADYVKQLEHMKVTRPAKFQHQILGGWLDKAEGVVFRNWSYGAYPSSPKTEVWGQDFGFSVDPSTLVRVCIVGRQIHVKLEYYKAGLTTGDIIARNARYVSSNGLIIADSAEPRLIAEMRSKGLNVRPTHKRAGSVGEGLKLMEDYEIIVDGDDDSMRAAASRELNNYVWSDKKGNVPIDAHNHFIDAFRYAAQYLLMNSVRGRYGVA